MSPPTPLTPLTSHRPQPRTFLTPTPTPTPSPPHPHPPGFINQKDKSFPRSIYAFTLDGIGIVIGSLLGCAPLTVCLESAAGIREGGRTGMTAITVGGLAMSDELCVMRDEWWGAGPGVSYHAPTHQPKNNQPTNQPKSTDPTKPTRQAGLCFFLSMFFTPLIVSIPPYATGPALIIVGALMMEVRGGVGVG
jgi:AGZA family xanthine/uracil permease-like MFS transporter